MAAAAVTIELDLPVDKIAFVEPVATAVVAVVVLEGEELKEGVVRVGIVVGGSGRRIKGAPPTLIAAADVVELLLLMLPPPPLLLLDLLARAATAAAKD